MKTPTTIENPILNSPFEKPRRHFRFDENGITDQIMAARRTSSYFIPIAQPKKKSKDHQQTFEGWTEDRIEENKTVNAIRPRVTAWRQRGYPDVTRTTARLVEHWTAPERERRLFFCQIEALETIIYVTEVAKKYGDAWIENDLRKLGVKAVYDLSATPFFLRGSGYREGTLFIWVVFDFLLIDAMHSGIVKVPRVPVADDSMRGEGRVAHETLPRSRRCRRSATTRLNHFLYIVLRRHSRSSQRWFHICPVDSVYRKMLDVFFRPSAWGARRPPPSFVLAAELAEPLEDALLAIVERAGRDLQQLGRHPLLTFDVDQRQDQALNVGQLELSAVQQLPLFAHSYGGPTCGSQTGPK